MLWVLGLIICILSSTDFLWETNEKRANQDWLCVWLSYSPITFETWEAGSDTLSVTLWKSHCFSITLLACQFTLWKSHCFAITLIPHLITLWKCHCFAYKTETLSVYLWKCHCFSITLIPCMLTLIPQPHHNTYILSRVARYCCTSLLPCANRHWWMTKNWSLFSGPVHLGAWCSH